MKLIKCSDYVIELKFQAEMFIQARKYANFLKRPLELGMFVVCDLEGNVLEEPKRIDYKDVDGIYDEKHWEINNEQYQEAKERVLFEGFETDGISENRIWLRNERDGFSVQYSKSIKDFVYGAYEFRTIEDLTELGLTLTDNAVKQLN